MRKSLTFLTVLVLAAGAAAAQTDAPKGLAVTAADVQKLKWIEGSWRGTGGGVPPFFERYRFESPTVLLVDSLEDGKVKETSRYEIRNGGFWSGQGATGAVATALNEKSITFEFAARRGNGFRWERQTADTWRAVLFWPATGNKPAGERVYTMERMASAQQAPAAAPALPRVHLFATGGTISNRAGGRMTADELVKSIPNLERRVQATAEQFLNVASSEITLTQWLDLAKRINEKYRAEKDLAGVVVTSGTDTLEELAYFLHLTVRDERPVVVTGAMRNPSTLGYEGAANLEDAFLVAASPAARGIGAVVVLNDQINGAREVTKTDSKLLSTFSSGEYGVLGTVLDRVHIFRRPVGRHSAASEFDVTKMTTLPRVDVIWTYQGAPGDLIKAAADLGAKGVIIATAGAGATSGTQGEGIAYAITKEVFVVTTTRAGAGSVGIGRGASRRILADDLQPIKARILLMVALATTSDPAEIQRIFREY